MYFYAKQISLLYTCKLVIKELYMRFSVGSMLPIQFGRYAGHHQYNRSFRCQVAFQIII